MAHAEARVEARYDLTVFRVQGELTYDDIIGFMDEHYNESMTRLVLWDGREATVAGISADDFRRIAHAMKRYAQYRDGGKTAFVGAKEIDYGLGRMYESYAEIEQIPCEHRTFRNISDAREWLGVSV